MKPIKKFDNKKLIYWVVADRDDPIQDEYDFKIPPLRRTIDYNVLEDGGLWVQECYFGFFAENRKGSLVSHIYPATKLEDKKFWPSWYKDSGWCLKFEDKTI